jgi:hypothetical protein
VLVLVVLALVTQMVAIAVMLELKVQAVLFPLI